jgi:hypothetical protein
VGLKIHGIFLDFFSGQPPAAVLYLRKCLKTTGKSEDRIQEPGGKKPTTHDTWYSASDFWIPAPGNYEL